MAGEGKGSGSGGESPSRKALRLRASAERDLIRAKSKLDDTEREWDEAYTNLKQLRQQLVNALDQGNDTSVIRELVDGAEKSYKAAEKLYKKAKGRYLEAEEDLQESIGGEAEPLPDIKLFKFEPLSLDSLRESVNTEVELPLVAQLLGERGQCKLAEKVFMRQEYIEFLEAWLESPEGLMLIGSPGLGKSVCALIALEYKLRESSSNAVVWMWDCVGGPLIYMRWGEMIYYMESNYRLVRKLCGSAPERVTFVYDGCRTLHYMFPPAFSHGLAVYSPDSAESFRDTENEGFVLWCMKAWTGKEVARWAELQGANVELALEIFDRLGGDIRDVGACLSPGRDWEESLEEAKSFFTRDLQEGASEPSLAAANMNGAVGHHVLHWGPSDAGRDLYEQFFCSRYARKRYLRWLMKDRLKLLRQPPEGFAFEAAVLGHMEANDETRFKVRSLEGAGGGEFAVKGLKWERWMVYNGLEDVPEVCCPESLFLVLALNPVFESRERGAAVALQGGLWPGVVYVPRSKTEPGVDAFWVDEAEGLVFLQVTLETEHPVMGDHIANVVNRLNARSAQLWFVTPPRDAGDFERQRIVTWDNKEYTPGRGNAPNVSQSVAYILTSGDEGE